MTLTWTSTIPDPAGRVAHDGSWRFSINRTIPPLLNGQRQFTFFLQRNGEIEDAMIRGYAATEAEAEARLEELKEALERILR